MVIPHNAAPFLTAAPILLMLVSIPLVLNRIPKDKVYGIRNRRMLPGAAHERSAANQKAGLVMLYTGLAFLAIIVFLTRL